MVLTAPDPSGDPGLYQVDDVIVIDPGSGYSQDITSYALVEAPGIQYEDIVSVPTVQGFAGIVTGITYFDGSDNPINPGIDAVRFYYRIPSENALDLGQLQPGYPVVVSSTPVGPGAVNPITSGFQPVSIGGSFMDAVYEVRSHSFLSFTGYFQCNLGSSISDPNLPSGVNFAGENLGQFSWGRLGGMTREGLAFNKIYDPSRAQPATVFTPDMRNFPEITRTSGGLRDQGGINKTL